MAVEVQVTFDCAQPAKLAEFWALTLGYIVQPPPAGFASWQDWLRANSIPESDWDAFSAVIDPEGKGPRLFFQRVPEGKTVKNRVHLDVNIGGSSGTPTDQRRAKVDAAVPRLVAAGARQVRAVEERGEYHVVMQDPEGNEFCLQ
jgi:hypothetical protein